MNGVFFFPKSSMSNHYFFSKKYLNIHILVNIVLTYKYMKTHYDSFEKSITEIIMKNQAYYCLYLYVCEIFITLNSF